MAMRTILTPRRMDLDRTDRLPILEARDPRSERRGRCGAARAGGAARGLAPPLRPGGARGFRASGTVDLPSLAESVRSVEERIARQSAEYEELSRLYERARNAESAAVARANTAPRGACGDALGTRVGATSISGSGSGAGREKHHRGKRAQTRRGVDARMGALSERDARAARFARCTRGDDRSDAAFARRARCAARARCSVSTRTVVPVLEARSQASAQLEVQMQELRSGAEASALELQEARRSLSARAEQIKRGEYELHVTRRELSTVSSAGGLVSGSSAHPRMAPRFRSESVPRMGREDGCGARGTWGAAGGARSAQADRRRSERQAHRAGGRNRETARRVSGACGSARQERAGVQGERTRPRGGCGTQRSARGRVPALARRDRGARKGVSRRRAR